jgi:hypothetical protein
VRVVDGLLQGWDKHTSAGCQISGNCRWMEGEGMGRTMVHTPSASLMQAGSEPSKVGAYSLPASRPITNSSCLPSIFKVNRRNIFFPYKN